MAIVVAPPSWSAYDPRKSEPDLSDEMLFSNCCKSSSRGILSSSIIFFLLVDDDGDDDDDDDASGEKIFHYYTTRIFVGVWVCLTARLSLAHTTQHTTHRVRKRRRIATTIEEYITPIQLELTAKGVVDEIETILAEGEVFYAFGAGKYREDEEAWARSIAIIFKENGDSLKRSELKKNYEWKSVFSLYTSTNPDNVNAVEKRVHQLMYEDTRSIWLECGMGGVSHVYEDGKYLMQTFTLGIIHGPSTGLSFAAKHPRKHITI